MIYSNDLYIYRDICLFHRHENSDDPYVYFIDARTVMFISLTVRTGDTHIFISESECYKRKRML